MPSNAILCTRFRLINVFSKIALGQRFWLEHVCKVCAQLAFLLQFYNDHAPIAFFAPLGGICVVFYAVLTLAVRKWCEILGD